MPSKVQILAPANYKNIITIPIAVKSSFKKPKAKILYTSYPTDIVGWISLFIKGLKIEPAVIAKIYEKHFVLPDEIEKVLNEGKPIFKKVGGNQYVAIGLADRYLTIFFTYNSKTKESTVTTAYPSSKKQIKSYKRLTRSKWNKN